MRSPLWFATPSYSLLPGIQIINLKILFVFLGKLHSSLKINLYIFLMGISIQPEVTDRTSRILGFGGSETKAGISVNPKASTLGSVIE